jgi:hypothetical protein
MRSRRERAPADTAVSLSERTAPIGDAALDSSASPPARAAE